MRIPCLHSFDKVLEQTHGFETDFLRVLYYDFPQYYKDIYHSYEYPRFCTILNGQKKVAYDGCTPFTYDESQFLILPPNSSVLMEITIPTRAFVLEINDNLIQEVNDKVSNDLEMEIPLETQQNCFNFGLAPYVSTAFNHVVNACFGDDRNKAFLMDLYAQELAYHLICVKSIRGILANTSTNPILRTVWHMSTKWNEKISLEDLAAMANMSINTYILQFKKLTGLTPAEYRTGIKMGHARDMLHNKTVTEVALELGYESISHFIHLFKTKYGVTPKQFQKFHDVTIPIEDEPMSIDFSLSVTHEHPE